MKITGEEIIEAVLESVTAERPTGSDATEDADVIARRSRWVIDSANLSPNLLGQRTVPHAVSIAPDTDTITWAATAKDPPENHINSHPPSEIEYWTVVVGGEEYRTAPSGRLTSLDEWLLRTDLGSGGWPRMLYWERNLNANGEQVLRFAPVATQEYEFRIYAKTPYLVQVERGQEYDLPQGLAAYLIALMTIDAATPFGFQVTPQMSAALKAAEYGLRKVPAPRRARASSPDWLDLDGRAVYGRLEHW